VPLDSLRKNPKHFHSEACFCEENSLSLAFDRRGIPRFARKDKMNCVFRIRFARWPLYLIEFSPRLFSLSDFLFCTAKPKINRLNPSLLNLTAIANQPAPLPASEPARAPPVSPARARTLAPVPLVIRAQRLGLSLAMRTAPSPARIHFPRELLRDSHPSHGPRLQAFASRRLPSHFRPASIVTVIANPRPSVSATADLNPHAALHLNPDAHPKPALHLHLDLHLLLHLTVHLNSNVNLNYENQSQLNHSPDFLLSSKLAHPQDRPASHPFPFSNSHPNSHPNPNPVLESPQPAP
jgi:hypothetical protein